MDGWMDDGWMDGWMDVCPVVLSSVKSEVSSQSISIAQYQTMSTLFRCHVSLLRICRYPSIGTVAPYHTCTIPRLYGVLVAT
jgi:hypothetical protein